MFAIFDIGNCVLELINKKWFEKYVSRIMSLVNGLIQDVKMLSMLDIRNDLIMLIYVLCWGVVWYIPRNWLDIILMNDNASGF